MRDERLMTAFLSTLFLRKDFASRVGGIPSEIGKIRINGY